MKDRFGHNSANMYAKYKVLANQGQTASSFNLARSTRKLSTQLDQHNAFELASHAQTVATD